MSRPEGLPEFDNPPVIEVVLCAQFSTEDPLTAPMLGAYWQRIRGDFPRVEEHPYLPAQIESLGAPSTPNARPGPKFETGFPAFMSPRCWFLTADGARLIQLQRDRFIHNWRKTAGQGPYPRYEAIRDEFQDRWKAFDAFAQDEGLGTPKVTQVELTYVNHIEQGTCWETMGDAVALFTPLAASSADGVLPEPESLSWGGHFRLPDELGRLHVTLEPVWRGQDAKAALRMTLTARGPVSDGGDVLRWFDEARTWVVNGFTELTTPAAHEHWERTR